MKDRKFLIVLGLALLVAGLAASGFAQDKPGFTISGATYTKFLWGNQRDQGSLYNFTTVPGEGYGNNGQGSEVELFLKGKLNRKVELYARLHSRFSQNFWTNIGGWGGSNPPTVPCVSGDCGEFDSRSNQYVKLRGVAVTFTPGYSWLDSATVGSNDWGQFDPFVIGRIRYIDRDNVAGLLFQGSLADRKLKWDAARISLPRLWAGPEWKTGAWHSSDAVYAFQAKYVGNSMVDAGAILDYVNDQEIDATDWNLDNGRDMKFRFHNTVFGAKIGVHPNSKFDLRGAIYHSTSETNDLFSPKDFFGISGFSPIIAGKHNDNTFKANVDLNDPFDMGISFNFEAFSIGSDYVSVMAARREADVLITEGHDSAWAFPGPSNAAYGVFGGNPTRIGYGGWDGNAQQVATISVDNEFTDFIEPMAETVIGWKGFTVTPVIVKGAIELSGEYTHLGYNTNWQAYGDDSRSVMSSLYPTMELDTGVGHNFRSAYAPFQDKKTDIALAKFKYVADVGKGVDLFGKVKIIREKDNRMNDARYLPYQPNGDKNYYSGSNTTADLYGAPPTITVNGVTGYQWKPFDSLADDNRDLKYSTFMIGAGYQLSDELYGSVSYQYYRADLNDGNTAFQAYQLHELASGQHHKNQFIVKAKYNLAGAEIGFEYQYNKGDFAPDFGGGYVVQYATESIAKDHNVAVGSPGFSGRYGGWNSLATRNFSQQRIQAFMKVLF